MQTVIPTITYCNTYKTREMRSWVWAAQTSPGTQPMNFDGDQVVLLGSKPYVVPRDVA